MENPDSVETAEDTFSGIYENDIRNAATLEALLTVIHKIAIIEESKRTVGIDESGTRFADDITGNISALSEKKQRGEALSDEDFQTVTRRYGLRDKIKELLG